MYQINRVNEDNISSLLSLIELKQGKNSHREEVLRQKIQRREGIYYLLEKGESPLAYAHWIQDAERDAWIRLQTIATATDEEIIPITEILMYTSETSFRTLYEKVFERTQVLGARFERDKTNNPLKNLYRSLGYHLIDDDPQELWEKQFPRRELETPLEMRR